MAVALPPRGDHPIDPATAPGLEPIGVTSQPRPRLGFCSRLLALVLATGLLAVLVTARWLQPDPNGFGTHTQLGLPPCSYRLKTGSPCPTCGLTTSLAWMVRGRVDRAWSVQPGGVVLGPLFALQAAWLLGAAGAGRPPGMRTLSGPLMVGVVAAVAWVLGAWSLRF